MDTLPKEIINIILEFQGYHKWRYGKYIPRISTEDPRRIKLLQLPKQYMVSLQDSIMNVLIKKRLDNKEMFIIIQRLILPNNIVWIMRITKWCFYSSIEYNDRIDFVLK